MRGLSGSAVTDVAMATRVARVTTLVCMFKSECGLYMSGKAGANVLDKNVNC
jgi:hypothetical protein